MTSWRVPAFREVKVVHTNAFVGKGGKMLLTVVTVEGCGGVNTLHFNINPERPDDFAAFAALSRLFGLSTISNSSELEGRCYIDWFAS